MKENEVKEKFPSICHNCEFARRPASDKNRDKGYVGCAKFLEKQSHGFVTEGEELAEGWVDLKARVFSKPSGVITNYQLLTLGIKKCKLFEQIES